MGSSNYFRENWRKKITFSLIALLLGYTVLEGFSFGLYFLARGDQFSFSKMINTAKQVGEANEPSALDVARFNALHPYLGYVYNPERNSKESTNYHRYPISEYGFVDRAPPIRKREPDKVIIGVFGGSVAYWFSVHGIEALQTELKKHPRFSAKTFVVVRAALGGYKQPQQLLALTYLLGLGAQFDIIVNLDGFNEVAIPPVEHIPKNFCPFYPRNWPVLAGHITDPHIAALTSKITDVRKQRVERAKRYSTRPYCCSVTLGLLWQAQDKRLSTRISRLQQDLQEYTADPARMSYTISGVKRTYLNDTDLFADLAEVWKTCSLQMHRLCGANGIKYFHFLQPNQYVPGSKALTQVEKAQSYRRDHPYKCNVEKGYPYLRRAAVELSVNGARFHDLSMAFANTKEPIYIDPCCHFNKRGNAILGEIIGRHMVTDLQAVDGQNDQCAALDAYSPGDER